MSDTFNRIIFHSFEFLCYFENKYFLNPFWCDFEAHISLYTQNCQNLSYFSDASNRIIFNSFEFLCYFENKYFLNPFWCDFEAHISLYTQNCQNLSYFSDASNRIIFNSFEFLCYFGNKYFLNPFWCGNRGCWLRLNWACSDGNLSCTDCVGVIRSVAALCWQCLSLN